MAKASWERTSAGRMGGGRQGPAYNNGFGVAGPTGLAGLGVCNRKLASWYVLYRGST